jgi:hypothetical protein
MVSLGASNYTATDATAYEQLMGEPATCFAKSNGGRLFRTPSGGNAPLPVSRGLIG